MRSSVPCFLAVALVLECCGLNVAAQDTKASKPTQAAGKRQTPVPTYGNVKYGPSDANAMDLWLANSDKPTPVLVNIHGGGFRAGSKAQFSPTLLDLCGRNGISFVSVEYRLTKEAQYPAQMHDCARAVQFLRANAKKWNLDPKRFAATGGSAGAGISVWLAFHDDLADPKSDDPVSRQSTRLTCAMVGALQSTYDPRVIRKVVPGNAYDVAPIKFLFGLSPAWNWDTDKVDAALDAKLKDGSPITHLTPDDAPIFVYHNAKDNVSGNIHHANFGIYLKEQMDKAGVECVRHMDTDYPGGPAELSKDMFGFMMKHFGLGKS